MKKLFREVEHVIYIVYIQKEQNILKTNLRNKKNSNFFKNYQISIYLHDSKIINF